jgi:hypothetical protein
MQDVQHLEASLAKDYESKFTKHDRRLFRGTAVQVFHDQTDDGILSAAHANFDVEVKKVEYTTEDGLLSYPEKRVWYRNDNKRPLGVFGTRRQVIQPSDFIRYFRTFCSQSEKAITLDVVGTLNEGRVFYMGSKLTGDNISDKIGGTEGFGISRNIPQEDRSDFWLVLTDYYGESKAPKAQLLINSLVCDNGMTRKVDQKLCSLTHLRQQSSSDVHAVLRQALREQEIYYKLQDRMMDVKVSRELAEQALKTFCKDYEGETRKYKTLVDIYDNKLIGGHLDSRKGTAWGLVNTVTQYTSRTSTNQDSAMRSQLHGTRGADPQKFMQQLASQFDEMSPIRELVTA